MAFAPTTLEPMPEPWSEEDSAVWDSLVSAGYVDPDAPPSLLSVVTGACRYERARILDNLYRLPEDDIVALRNVVVWLMMGAPDRDPR